MSATGYSKYFCSGCNEYFTLEERDDLIGIRFMNSGIVIYGMGLDAMAKKKKCFVCDRGGPNDACVRRLNPGLVEKLEMRKQK